MQVAAAQADPLPHADDPVPGAFRPAEMRLRDGGGFDYVYLYQHPTSGTACLQTSYTQEGAVGTAASPITN